MALTKINASVIANNTIAVGNIADNSVDATKIASNSILTRHIDDDQITGDQLADNISIAGTLASGGDLTVEADGAEIFLKSADHTVSRIIPRGTGADLDKGLLSLFDAGTEDIRIDTGGNSWIDTGHNVGIGTTSPSFTLHVLDTIGTRSLSLGHGVSTGTITTDSAKDLNFQQAGTTMMTLQEAGHLEFSPVSSFSGLNNSILASSNTYLYVMGGTAGLFLGDNSDLSNSIGIRNANYIDFNTNGTEKLRLDSGGDLTLKTAGKRYYVPRASDAAATGSLYSPSGNDIRLSGAGSSSGTLSFEPSSTSGASMTMDSNGFAAFYHNSSEYGMELKSASNRTGLVLKTPGTNNITGSVLLLSDTTYRLGTASYYHIIMYQTGATKIMNGLELDDGDLKVANGHGVDFSATGDGNGTMGSELLDDYEEGSWTVGVSSSDPGSMTATVSNSYGWYVKVGKLVTVGGSFDLSTSSPQGTMRITGLPYSCSANGTRPLFVGSVGYTINIVPQPHLVTLGNGSSESYLDVWKQGNNTRYNVSDFNNGGRMNFQISYETA